MIIHCEFYPFQSLLRRFVRRDLLQDLTPVQLIKKDLTDEKNLLSPKTVDIGLGAETAIKVILVCVCAHACVRACVSVRV